MTRPPFALPAAPLRLAAVQAEAVPGDPAANARRAAALTARAADEGARVVVLPELHLCGYDLTTLVRAPDRCETPADADGRVTDSRLDPLAAAAAEHRVTVLTGAAVRRTGAARTNSVVAFGPDGTATAVYDKHHLWQNEEQDVFAPGDRGTVLRTGDWLLGLGLCYDMSFPEHARGAALSGAHAYVCPSAFVAGAEHRAAVHLAARALENTVHSVFVNPVGGPSCRPCAGGTAAYGPDGTALRHAGTGREAVLHVTLDPSETAKARRFLRMLSEHRTRYAPPADPSVVRRV